MYVCVIVLQRDKISLLSDELVTLEKFERALHQQVRNVFLKKAYKPFYKYIYIQSCYVVKIQCQAKKFKDVHLA